jgi:hypothetical protein
MRMPCVDRPPGAVTTSFSAAPLRSFFQRAPGSGAELGRGAGAVRTVARVVRPEISWTVTTQLGRRVPVNDRPLLARRLRVIERTPRRTSKNDRGVVTTGRAGWLFVVDVVVVVGFFVVATGGPAW